MDSSPFLTLLGPQASLSEGELTSANCSVAVVGRDLAFTLLEDDKVEPYVTALKEEEPEPMQVGRCLRGTCGIRGFVN